jgi:hypothetical protein
MTHRTTYQSDTKKGKSLSVITTQGWVEYLNELGQVYYFPQVNSSLYKNTQGYLVDKFPAEFQGDAAYLGWINHLAQQRLVGNFTLPMFGTVDPVSNAMLVQCGHSRFAASIICGVSPDKIPMIAFSKSRMHVSVPCERLQSTQQFDELFGLGAVDYELTFTVAGSLEVEFTASPLKHTIYEQMPFRHHSTADDECKKFWSTFQQGNKYKIQIHGTAQTRSLVVPSKYFEIEYVEKNTNEWEASYGMMLGEFNEISRLHPDVPLPRLQLWLYDVTEPVNLEFMIPWMTSRHNFYRTQNEKAVIIYGAEMSTGLQVIGNWVK